MNWRPELAFIPEQVSLDRLVGLVQVVRDALGVVDVVVGEWEDARDRLATAERRQAIAVTAKGEGI